MDSVSVPLQHAALVYDKPGQLSTKVVTVDTPKPGHGDVLVNITHSGVCRSDLSVMMRRWSYLGNPTQAGQVGGHEGIGKVVAFGPGTEHSGLKIGDRVGIKWMARVCGSCQACMFGRDGCCSNGSISGYEVPGTFQQYVLAPANYVTPIPDALSSEMAAPMLCGGITVYAALGKCGAQPGDAIVIMGATGGLGHLALQMGGKGMGYRMIGVDYGDKGDFAAECGAEFFFDMSRYSNDKSGMLQLAKDIKAITRGGDGAAAVIVCTASNEAYAAAVGLLRFGGKVVCVGVPEGQQVPIPTADPASLISKELSIVGSVVGNRLDAIGTLDMAARGVVVTRYAVEPMSKLNEVFEKMDNMELKGRMIIDLTKV